MDGFYVKSSPAEGAPATEDNRNILFAEEFQVDDLLDLRGLPETEKSKGEEDGDAAKGAAFDDFEKEEAFHLSEIRLPEENEAAHLEWLSRFVDDCHSEYPPAFAAMAGKHAACFPMKQLSLSATVAVSSLNKKVFIPVKAKRSKRPRRAGSFWSLSGTSPVSSITTASVFSSSSPSSSYSSSSSYIFYEPYPSPARVNTPKKRGRKPKTSITGDGASGERRCMHCGVQKTPQWRAGPLGPKTLCNACGVRFKSGRLLPEYRPACSPTFVSHIHSNNHRKVLEMRRKKEAPPFFPAAAQPVDTC